MDFKVAISIQIAECHGHSGSTGAVESGGAAQAAGRLGEGAILVVDPQGIGGFVVGDIHIGPPISVEIGGSHCQPVAFHSGNARTGTHIGELPLAIILQQPIGEGSSVSLRVAIVTPSSKIEASSTDINRPVQVSGDEEIKIAVPVVIHKTRRHRKIVEGRAGGL